MSVPETPHGPRPPRNKDRRKSYRIDPKFQNRFRAAMLAFAVVILLLAQLTSLGVAYAATHPVEYLQTLWLPVGWALLSIPATISIFYLSDRLSHRLCGPVFIMRRTLEAVRRWERPKPIQLRRRDEFRELANELNATLVALDAMDEKAEERTL